MAITVDFMGIGLFVLYALACAVCVFLLVMVHRVNGLVKKVDAIAERNGENINSILAQLPAFTKNANDVVLGLGFGIDKIGSVIGSVDRVVTRTITAVNCGASNVLDVVAIVRDLAMGAFRKNPAKKKEA